MNSLTSLYNDSLSRCLDAVSYPVTVPYHTYKLDACNHYCGDDVTMKLWIDRGMVFIAFDMKACLLVKGSARFLQSRITSKPPDQAICEIHAFLHPCDLPPEQDGLPHEYHYLRSIATQGSRSKCIRLPWTMALQGLESASVCTPHANSSDTDNTGVDLANQTACDACITVTDLSPLKKQRAPQRPALCFQRFGKLVLTDKDRRYLKKHYPRLGETELELLRRWRISAIARDNLVACGVDNHTLNHIVTYESIRNKVQLEKLAVISTHMKQKGITTRIVKGGAVYAYYPASQRRFFNDLDIIVQNLGDFFAFIQILQFDLGFTLVPELGMALSFKQVLIDSQRVLTGHAHFGKRFDGYHVGIDIAFPNLPLGRYSSIHTSIWEQPNRPPSVEDLFLVALTHLFKHSMPSIKDLNDLYILAAHDSFDWQYVLKLAQANHILFRLMVVVIFLQKDYQLQSIPASLIPKKMTCQILGMGLLLLRWPYFFTGHHLLKRIEHFFHKRIFANPFTKRADTRKKGRAHKMGFDAECPFNRFFSFSPDLDIQRIYAIPLVLFTQKAELDDAVRQKLECISTRPLFTEPPANAFAGLHCHGKKILLTNFGLFFLKQTLTLEAAEYTDLQIVSQNIIRVFDNLPCKNVLSAYWQGRS